MNALYQWVRTFTKPVRNRPRQLALDGFDSEFFLQFDFEEDPETPASAGTCDVTLVPLVHDDRISVRLLANADKRRVLRLLAALGISRFNEATRAAFYQAHSILRSPQPADVDDVQYP